MERFSGYSLRKLFLFSFLFTLMVSFLLTPAVRVVMVIASDLWTPSTYQAQEIRTVDTTYQQQQIILIAIPAVAGIAVGTVAATVRWKWSTSPFLLSPLVGFVSLEVWMVAGSLAEGLGFWKIFAGLYMSYIGLWLISFLVAVPGCAVPFGVSAIYNMIRVCRSHVSGKTTLP